MGQVAFICGCIALVCSIISLVFFSYPYSEYLSNGIYLYGYGYVYMALLDIVSVLFMSIYMIFLLIDYCKKIYIQWRKFLPLIVSVLISIVSFVWIRFIYNECAHSLCEGVLLPQQEYYEYYSDCSNGYGCHNSTTDG